MSAERLCEDQADQAQSAFGTEARSQVVQPPAELESKQPQRQSALQRLAVLGLNTQQTRPGRAADTGEEADQSSPTFSSAASATYKSVKEEPDQCAFAAEDAGSSSEAPTRSAVVAEAAATSSQAPKQSAAAVEDAATSSQAPAQSAVADADAATSSQAHAAVSAAPSGTGASGVSAIATGAATASSGAAGYGQGSPGGLRAGGASPGHSGSQVIRQDTGSYRPQSMLPFNLYMLLFFLCLHLLALVAQAFAMWNFLYTGDLWFFSFLCAPFLFTGVICTHCAWYCKAPEWAPDYLPLKEQPLPLALLLAIPFGFMQIIIVILALEEYSATRSGERRGQSAGDETASSVTTNKFHLKAVNGLFEGLVSAAVLLYAYWTLDYPKDTPITVLYYGGERFACAVAGCIMIFSSGLGLLELDRCTSYAISERMQQQPAYELAHWVFRTTEVVMRVNLLVWFMVTMRLFSWLWWVPTALDLGLTVLLVFIFGGAESTPVVRLLCGVPCLFANIFLFIDSPYKRGAARRLSRWLNIKNMVSLFLLPLIVLVTKGPLAFNEDWEEHNSMVVNTIICVPVYWALLAWISAKQLSLHNIPDIYTACARGSEDKVNRAIEQLTRCAALGLNVNCPDTDGNTPLVLAADGGHARVCELLVREGARIDQPVFADNRPLRQCLLLSARRKWTAVHVAAHKGHTDVLKVLLAASSTADPAGYVVDFNALTDAVGDNPLHIALRAGHADAVRELRAAHPAWAEQINEQGQRPGDIVGQSYPPAVDSTSSPLQAGLLPPVSPLSSYASAVRELDLWPQMQLFIDRTSKHDQLWAPGLCSYVAGSCGGALGRVFLGNTVGEIGGGLSSINEDDEADPELGAVPSSDVQAWCATVRERTRSRAQSAESSGGAAPELAVEIVTMEDLEPIDSHGNPIEQWVQRRPPSLRDRVGGWHFLETPAVAELGRGSFGTVWRARHTGRDHWYAVKNLNVMQGSVVARECQMANWVSRTPHPCIVQLHHIHNFPDVGLMTIVMEFCPGGSVYDRMLSAKRDAGLQRKSYQPPQQSLAWIGQVFLALEHMHLRMKALFRDLKPANIVLTAENHAKLTDFGTSRFGVQSTGRWSYGIPPGSPGYIAPEVLRREQYDTRADLYSMGVLVWTLFTGGLKKNPFPTPPSLAGGSQDFNSYLRDYQELARCIANPERNGARRLNCVATEFVAGLTHRDPMRRMLHPQIRDHALLQSLHLPSMGASPAEVRSWIRDVTAAAS